MPKVKHPVSGMVIGVKPDRAEKLIARGYKLVDEQAPSEKAAAARQVEEEQAAPAPGPEAEGNQGDGEEANAPARPGGFARKATWVAYAEALGIDTEGKSKQQIIEAVEAHEAD